MARALVRVTFFQRTRTRTGTRARPKWPSNNGQQSPNWATLCCCCQTLAQPLAQPLAQVRPNCAPRPIPTGRAGGRRRWASLSPSQRLGRPTKLQRQRQLQMGPSIGPQPRKPMALFTAHCRLAMASPQMPKLRLALSWRACVRRACVRRACLVRACAL